MAGAAAYPWNSSSTVTSGALTPGYTVSFPAGGRGGSIQADGAELHELYESDKAAYWDKKGYDGKIFEKQLGFLDSLFNNDLKDDVLAKDKDFIRAARIVYEAEEGKPWPGAPTKTNEDLTEWVISHMRAVKINSAVGIQNAVQNYNADQHVRDAFKYVADAYDAKDWTWGGVFHGLKWGIFDPVNAIPGGFIARRGMRAVNKLVNTSGFFKKAAKFVATTVAPAAFLGAGSNALQSVAVEQQIDHDAQAQESWHDWGKTGWSAAIGGGMGAGFSVVGGGIAGAAGKAFGKKAGGGAPNAAAQTPSAPNYSDDPIIKAAETAIEKQAQPTLNTSNAKIDLPEFELKRDWIKFWAQRNWNPLTGFTSLGSPTVAMWVRSIGITRPVIEAVDKRFADLSLIGTRTVDKSGKITQTKGFLDKMQDELLAKFENGGSKTDFENILNNFSQDPQTLAALKQIRVDVQALREHVGKVDYKIDEVSNKFYGLNIKQKKALIKWLSDMDKLAEDLTKGAQGNIGQEALQNLQKIKNGELDIGDVRSSITGLTRANWIANESFTRHTGHWPNGVEARIQSPRSLERSIDVGFYSDKAWKEAPITYYHLGSKNKAENLEFIWQNKLLDRYAGRDKDGNALVDWDNDPEATPNFFGLCEQLYKAGFGHRALFTVDNLQRLKQHKAGQKDFQTVPTPSKLKAVIQADARYQKDESFTEWADALIEAVAGDTSKGAPKTSFRAYLFENNRPTQFRAFRRLYPYVFAFEWADRPSGSPWYMFKNAKLSPARQFFGETALSLPGNIYLANKYGWNFTMRSLYYVAGAKEFAAPNAEGFRFGQVKQYGSWEAHPHKWIETDEAKGKESHLSVIRRALIRTPSLGMIDDIPSFNPFKWKLTKTGKIVTLGGGTVAAPAFAASMVESGIETFAGEDFIINIPYTDYSFDADAGGRALEAQVQFADATAGSAFRFVTGSDAHIPYAWTGQGLFGDRYKITEERVLDALLQHKEVNGKLVPRSGPDDESIRFHPAAQLAAKGLLEDEADITDSAVLQKYFDVARETLGYNNNGRAARAAVGGGVTAGSVAEQAAGNGESNSGGTQSGNSSNSASSEQNPAPGQSSGNGGGENGRSGDGNNQQASGGTGTGTPYAQQAFNPASLYNNNNSSFVEEAGGWVADLFRGAASHSPAATSAVNVITRGASGLWGSVFKQDYEGKDDIIKWGLGLGAAYLGTMLITNTIPGTKWAGLFIFALLALWAPGAIASVRQGSGKFLSNDVQNAESANDNSAPAATDHNGRAQEIRLMTDSAKSQDTPWQEIRAVMKAGEGEFGVQLHTKDGRTFAPKNWVAMTQNEITPEVVARAKRDGTFIPENFLPSEADEAHEWKGEAVDHEGHGQVMVYKYIGNNAIANDPVFIVADIAG